MWQSILASSIVMIAFIVIIVVIYGLVSLKNVKKQKGHFKDIHKTLQKGQHVVLANGIHGTLKKIEKETVDLEIKSGAVMTVSRYAISDILN